MNITHRPVRLTTFSFWFMRSIKAVLAKRIFNTLNTKRSPFKDITLRNGAEKSKKLWRKTGGILTRQHNFVAQKYNPNGYRLIRNHFYIVNNIRFTLRMGLTIGFVLLDLFKSSTGRNTFRISTHQTNHTRYWTRAV